jgi:predicted RNA binding protein with dsRBD fold (UPF0201 family)
MKKQPTVENNKVFKASRIALNKATITTTNRSEYKKAVGIMETKQARLHQAWTRMQKLQQAARTQLT